MCGWLLIIVGILFLLRDLNVWDFWNISWWTAGFLLVGLGHVGKACCPDCQAMSKKK